MNLAKIILSGFLSILFLAGCSDNKKHDEIIVGTSADNPPYEFIKDGKIVGMDIDVINAIGKYIGKKVIIKNLDFHGLLAALTSKNVDVVVAGLSVTPARKSRVDFSDPYTTATVSVLYRTADGLSSTNDLKDRHIGAQLGTIWGQIAQDFSGKLHTKVHSLSNNLMLVEELKSKAVDAVILEEAQAKKFIANNPAFSYFLLEDFASEFAIALPSGSLLKASIDNAIRRLEEDGVLAEIRKKWLE